jgi:hypothetical protein
MIYKCLNIVVFIEDHMCLFFSSFNHFLNIEGLVHLIIYGKKIYRWSYLWLILYYTRYFYLSCALFWLVYHQCLQRKCFWSLNLVKKMTPYEYARCKRIEVINKKIHALNLPILAQSLVESSSATKKPSSVWFIDTEALEPFFYWFLIHRFKG